MRPALLRCMNEKAEQLKKRTKQFAIDVLAFGRMLPPSDEARDIGRQLGRAATSVASNYRACCLGRSHAEFVAKLGIALEEADESAFWLEVIVEAGLSRVPRAHALLDEANQLSAILARSRLTAGRR